MTSSNKVFSIALIGFGRIAEALYGPFIKNFQDVIICEPEINRHEIISALIPHAQIIDDINKLRLANDCSSVAFNLIPGPKHADITLKLIDKEWNVFSEKPAAATAESWLKMVEKAKLKNKILVSAPVTPYLPDIKNIKAQLDAHTVGEISEVHLNFFAAGPARRGYIDESRKWFFGKDSCVVRDLGPYPISCLVYLFDQPFDLQWIRNNYRPEILVKPQGSIIPEFGSAAVGIGKCQNAIITICVAYRPSINDVNAELIIIGEKGSLKASLDEQPKNNIHPFIKVEQVIETINHALTDKNFWNQHVNIVKNTLFLIEKSLK